MLVTPNTTPSDRPPIALVSNNRNKYSETFIHAQLHGLPAHIHHLYGDHLPLWWGEQWPISRYAAPFWARRRWRRPEQQSYRRLGISAYLRQNGIRAVLAQYGPAGVAMAPMCQALGIPLIVHFHGYDVFRRDVLAEYGTQYPVMFRQAAALIVVSEPMYAQLLHLGAPANKLHRLTCGADLRRFRPAGQPVREPHYVACGRFVPKKAPQLTIRAFAQVAREIPEARLTMIGAGELWADCQVLARELDLVDRINFPGILPPDQVATVLRQSLALVQPSLRPPSGDAEGTPLSILEAGAAALPVVATRHAGIPEVILDGETGYLVEEGDTETMAGAMLRLARDPDHAHALGRAARARITAHYTLDQYLQTLWQVITDTINKD